MNDRCCTHTLIGYRKRHLIYYLNPSSVSCCGYCRLHNIGCLHDIYIIDFWHRWYGSLFKIPKMVIEFLSKIIFGIWFVAINKLYWTLLFTAGFICICLLAGKSGEFQVPIIFVKYFLLARKSGEFKVPIIFVKVFFVGGG